MIISRILTIVSTLLASTCVLATASVQDSDPVPLNGGRVIPGHTLLVKLSPLQKDGAYTITCDIHNPNYNKEYPVVMHLGSSCFGNGAPCLLLSSPILINSTPIKANQTTLNQETSAYKIDQLTAPFPVYSNLTFVNLDNSDTVTVDNCTAKFVTQR